MGFAISNDQWVKLKENAKKDKHLDLARELKKNVEHESDGETDCNWCSHQKTDTASGGLRNFRTCGDYPNYSIVDIGQNAEKRSGDSSSSESPSANADGKNSQRVTIITIPQDHSVKIKESEKIKKYLNFSRGLKSLYNHKMTVIQE